MANLEIIITGETMPEYTGKFLVSLVFGVGALVAVAALLPTAVDYLSNASNSLSQLGVGGTIGSLILGILIGLVVAIGFTKFAANIFGVELGF